ncbi:hypothetical protein BH09BAC1_BH09BAC1_00700 [soil metagenome]
MKKIYIAILAAMLLLPATGAFAQSHLGLGVELLAPITPYSKGYGTGYGVALMYRNFAMTRSFMWDASIGFTRTSAKDPFVGEIDDYGNIDMVTPTKLGGYFWRFGFAWAFIPNGSPYTQPYAGFDVGYSLNTQNGHVSYGQYVAGLRIGWMTYINERFLFGFEAKYNGMVSSSGRNDSRYTSIADIYDHQMTFQLSSNIRLGR